MATQIRTKQSYAETLGITTDVFYNSLANKYMVTLRWLSHMATNTVATNQLNSNLSEHIRPRHLCPGQFSILKFLCSKPGVDRCELFTAFKETAVLGQNRTSSHSITR